MMILAHPKIIMLQRNGRQSMEFLARTEAAIADWHGVQPPNDAAHRFAADLAGTIAAFEALRETLEFEQEPSDFERALRETAA